MDSQTEEISIPFHRPWLMFKLVLLWPIALMGPFMVLVTGMAALFDTWHMDIVGRFCVLIEAIVFGFCSWQDIQKIYPGRLAWRFSRKRSAMKPNVIVILPKDMKQLASRYPLWKSLILKGDLAFGKNWAAILVRDISMSPRNLMQEINQFYITHVQESG